MILRMYTGHRLHIDNRENAEKFSVDLFSFLSKSHSSFHLKVLETIYILSGQPSLKLFQSVIFQPMYVLSSTQNQSWRLSIKTSIPLIIIVILFI